MICPSKIFLCDICFRFLEGTTDINRTLPLTKPGQERIENYILVLRSNMVPERTKFHEFTTDKQLQDKFYGHMNFTTDMGYIFSINLFFNVK